MGDVNHTWQPWGLVTLLVALGAACLGHSAGTTENLNARPAPLDWKSFPTWETTHAMSGSGSWSPWHGQNPISCPWLDRRPECPHPIFNAMDTLGTHKYSRARVPFGICHHLPHLEHVHVPMCGMWVACMGLHAHICQA